jgi:DNA-binding Lrp family transcriptional regulator
MGLPENDIDELDRKIILELQEDARRLYKDIAKKLKPKSSKFPRVL